MIEEAQKQGLSVTADAYPYTASFAELGVLLPDSLYQAPDRLNRLKDPAKKKRTLRQLRAYYQTRPVHWERIRVATVSLEKNKPLSGKTLLEISERSKKDPIETLVDLLAEEEFKVSAFYFSQSEAVVNQVLSKPYVALGSDSIADGSILPHPRAYGTFPRFLALCSQKSGGVLQNLCWGKAIYQMTELPAQILGLRERGKIGTGLYADLVLFDPRTVRDRADYENPKLPPEGIRWVFVNGKPVVREGHYQAVHSGLFLSKER